MELREQQQKKHAEEMKKEEEEKKKKEINDMRKKLARDKLDALKKTPIGARAFAEVTADVSTVECHSSEHVGTKGCSDNRNVQIIGSLTYDNIVNGSWESPASICRL